MSVKIINSPTSQRNAFTLVETLIVLVIVVLLAALAYPAMEKIRERYSQRAIIENLDSIALNGLLFLEEKNLSSVDFSTLEASGVLEGIESVAGEDYSSLKILRGGGTIHVLDKNGKKVYYEY